MATPEEIAAFRLTIGEADSTSTYTDQSLSDRLDVAGTDTVALAVTIWREKAARYSAMVDMQEGTSSRKLSQLYDHALKMASSLSEASDGSSGGSTGRRTTTRAIERV
jgi:hypothetical protein